ncbi:hypothetical protein C0584_03745 [Candidatus Parcubacteria bacterium]|nr:MAG: hypothetical protein C0584_03745 [Candidatus Parcubacteria bacterium]
MKNRVQKLREIYRSKGFDAYLVYGKEYIRYFTGIRFREDNEAFLCVTDSDMTVITDTRYKSVAEELRAKTGLFEVELASGLKKPEKIVEVFLGKAKKVGFDGYFLSHDLIDILRNRGLVCDSSHRDYVEDISIEKSIEEQEKSKEALAITELVFEQDVLPALKEGISEIELSGIISLAHKRRGAEGDSFDPIVLFGENTVLPHGLPGARRLKEGDIVQIDIGCAFEGICSDFSRVVSFGQPDHEAQHLHKSLVKAQRLAVEYLQEGRDSFTFHNTAVTSLKADGYDFNLHGIGHGAGIVIHCQPHISLHAEKTVQIPDGAIFTVEPGVYIEGWLGMRVENMLLMTSSGPIVLNKFPDDLIIL